MALKINTDPRPDEVEEIWFGDDGPYEFTSPKISPLLGAMRTIKDASEIDAGMIAVETQEKWLEDGFGPDQWKRIMARIDDKDDNLDYWHLLEVFEALFKKMAGRPPTSHGG